MAAGAAVAVVGWWTGYKLGGVVALVTAETLQQAGIPNYWQLTFLVLGAIVVLCNVALMGVPETPPSERTQAQAEYEQALRSQLNFGGVLAVIVTWLGTTLIGPLTSFFRRNGLAIALAVLGFIFLFKIGEAFLGRMVNHFLQGDRFLQDRYRALFQGNRLGHNRCLYLARRPFRGPGRTGSCDVSCGHLDGTDQSDVLLVGMVRQIRTHVRLRGHHG